LTTNLTDRQARVLDIIQSETAKRGFPPTVREIARTMGIRNPNGVKCHLDALRAKGYIETDAGVSRGIRLTDDAAVPGGYPVIGEVAAGGPVYANEERGERLSLEDASGARPGDFFLRVKGDSMTGAGIRPGDTVVVREDASPPDGSICVVMVEGEEATVKRIYREQDNRLRLVPENPGYEEIIPDEARILGRVVGVMRRY